MPATGQALSLVRIPLGKTFSAINWHGLGYRQLTSAWTVTPHRRSSRSRGLLLRRDLHRLFSHGLIAIDSTDTIDSPKRSASTSVTVPTTATS
ncbi:HNH endonuclease [Rhodococcus sp. (in: high G+C Gram-positive bacteria)]|uniref:HNH endonuclease n=1 Tax=Rhodococcus sp. TaxID=1831 RepID=UPI003BAE9321